MAHDTTSIYTDRLDEAKAHLYDADVRKFRWNQPWAGDARLARLPEKDKPAMRRTGVGKNKLGVAV